MNFKQFYLLKENPDYAQFLVKGVKYDACYDEDSHTFVILDECLFFSSRHYHGNLLEVIIEYFNRNFNQKILTDQKIIKLGQISSSFASSFLQKLEGRNYIFRSDMLRYFPNQLLGRTWIKQSDDKKYFLTSVWNENKYYNVKNLNLIKRLAEYFDVVNDDNILFEISTEKTKTLLEMMTSLQNNGLTGKSDSADKTGLKPVHELPPEQKRDALIKMGAKPKTPLNLADRMKLNAEQFIN